MIKEKIKELYKIFIRDPESNLLLVLSTITIFLNFFGIVTTELVLSCTMTLIVILSIILYKTNIANKKFIEKMENDLEVDKQNNASFMIAIESKIKNNIIDNIDLIWSEPNHNIDKNMIKDANEELLLIQETGNLITNNCRHEIIDFIKKGGILKMIVASHEDEVIEKLSMRNSELSADSIYRRSIAFHEELKNVITSNQLNCYKLEIRYLPYPMGHTAIMYDTTKDNVKCLIRYAGFQIPYGKKNAFIIEKNSSPNTYSNYLEQFNNMYACSYKKILLSGISKIGKTTIFKKIIENYGYMDNVYYLYTQEIKNDEDVRIGFKLMCTNENYSDKCFAEKLNDIYKCNYNDLESICNEILKFIDSIKYPIIIIDEIGKMQLENQLFRNTIERIISKNNCTLFATITCENFKYHNFVDKLKNDCKTKLIILDKVEDRESVLNELSKEIEGSVKMYNKNYERKIHA